MYEVIKQIISTLMVTQRETKKIVKDIYKCIINDFNALRITLP